MNTAPIARGGAKTQSETITYRQATRAQIEIRKIQAILKSDEYEKLVADLQDELLMGWDKQTRKEISKIISELKSGGVFTKDDLQLINKWGRQLLGKDFGKGVRKALVEIQAQAYGLAAEQVVGSNLSFQLVDQQALDWLEKHNVYWVRNHYDRQIQEKVTELGQKVIREGLSRRKATELFRDAFNNRFQQESYRYWEGFANHCVTRSREFGRVAAYERAGVEEIVVDAVLDHRTSTICRHMNGRIIQVSDAVELRNKMLNAKTPEEVIEIAPFMRPGDVSGTPTADLKSKSAGFALPPYHYSCRSRTVVYTEPKPENTVVDTRQGNALKDGHSDLLTDYTHEEYSNVIEMMRSRSQLPYRRKDFDHDFKKHAPDFGITSEKEYRLAANANMKGAQRITSHIYDGEKQYRFFGKNGITLVGSDFQIRGYYFHKDLQASMNAFEGYKELVLWLIMKKNSYKKR